MSQGNNMFSDIFPMSTAYAPPPSLTTVNPFKPVDSARSTRKTIVIVLVVVAVIVLAYLLWRARSRLTPLAAAAASKMRGGSKAASHDTFQHDIDRIIDPEIKADMKEWHSFWKISTRPVIKDMLTQVLTVNTQPQAPKQPMVVQTPVVPTPDISMDVDPNFTAI